MKRLPNETFLEFTLRFLNEHASFATKRTQQAAQCDENRKFAALSNQGEAQPVARLLENSEDIAEQYSKSFPHICRAQGCRNSRLRGAGDYCLNHVGLIRYSKVSEREKAGSRKEHSPQGRIPAPKKYFEMLRVDTACETVVASNRYGDKLCLCEGVGICKFCELIVCGNCLLDESCPNAPCGSSKHRVICQ